MAKNSVIEHNSNHSWRELLASLSKSSTNVDINDLILLKKEVEALSENENLDFVSIFVPWSFSVLTSLAPSQESTFQVRESILDMYSILPGLGDPIKPYLNDLMFVLIRILSDDFEVNGLTAMHLFMELNKVFRGAVEASVQPFIDLVLKLLENFNEISSKLLGYNAPSDTRLVPASKSLKIIIESPVMVVLLFQLHRKFINENILKFVPSIVKILELSIPAPSFSIGSRISDNLASVNGQIKSFERQHYCDFIQAKVKVLSFLAYVSRSFSSALKPYQAAIPNFVIDILKNCPPESASARKELLVAVRHILATDLRQAFVSQFETLLDDELLFGTGYTSGIVMRPLVFSTMADLVHHIRLDLSSQMIIKVIDIYARCFHDPSLPYGIQTMSAKLLLNLMDCVNSDKVDIELRRPLSMKILAILLRKYYRLSKVVEEINKRRCSSSLKSEKAYDAFWEDPFKSRIVCSDSISADSGKDVVRDIKFILKTVTAGIKSIILSFKTNYISFNPETDPPVHPVNAFSNSCNFSLEESRLFLDMFRDGVACFDICQSEVSTSNGSIPSGPVTSISAEDKELVDQFAYCFTLLDPYIFQDVLSTHIEYLFDRIVSNPLLLIIPQYFLAINTVSRNFAGILIKFLMEKFERIGENSAQSSSLLRLFKLIFLAVSVYPDENEQMILPYISDIILNCLRLSQNSAESINYFLILKALFRGIAGGRFEHLYKEVLPILPLLLETLNKLVTSTTDKQMQDLFVELCLTTPVRLSVLLPYLPFLMKPLVLSLKSETELVNQGLRTLELCVDNLTQDFLEPILAPVLPDLLNALWGLLRSNQSNHTQAQFALRILGKFGGRGRRFLKYPLNLKYVESKTNGLSLVFDPLPDSEKLLELPMDDLIDLCHEYFMCPDARHFEHSDEGQLFSILCTSLSSLCGFDINSKQPIDKEIAVGTSIPFESEIKIQYDEDTVQDRLRNQSQDGSLNANGSVLSTHFKKLLSSLFRIISKSDSKLNQKAKDVLTNICDRFIIVQILSQRNQAKDYSFTGITPNVFIEVFTEVICGPLDSHLNFAIELTYYLYSKLASVISAEKISELPLFYLFVEKLIAYCYGTDFNQKIGACRGLELLCKFNLGYRWMWMQESRIVRGLLYILKDVPAYATDGQKTLVSSTLLEFLKACHSDLGTSDAELKSKGQYYFNQIMSILTSELTNANAIVRQVVHSSFELLSKCQNCEVVDLLGPHRDRLLMPIFTKPLRALPFALQIGYVDAVNYCLNLKPPFVNFSEELMRLLHEALALVEADDTALVSKTGQLKNAQNLINLRVVCISLLSTAISCSEFQDPKMHQIRNHIVSAFFKSLYSKSPEIVSVARKGLELVILHQQKLPKDLLQHGLRPVLINLAEAKRLTLAGLEGLSKVLQLLTSYFKAEIGKKLLDHVTVWADQKLLEDLSGKPLLESMEIKIIAAILDVFHLLPPSANLFLDDLITTVQKLDTWTKRSLSSPFRPALFKFMCKHPSDTVAYLFSHSNSTFVVDLFYSACLSQDGLVLIEELNRSENLNIFTEKFFMNRSVLDRLIRIGALRILIEVLLKIDAKAVNIEVIKNVVLELVSGTAPAGNSAEIISSTGEECELVLDLAFGYLNLFNSVDVEVLNSVINGLESVTSCLDITWVPRHVRELCQKGTNKKEILNYFVESLSSSTIVKSTKSRIIRLILLPIIVSMKDQGLSLSKSLGSPLLQRIDKNVFTRECHDIESISDGLSLEEIQLTCLLLSFESASSDLKSSLVSIRKFIINRNFSPDPVIRYASLFASSFFIVEIGFDVSALDSIIKSSLNIPTSEVRPLLRQTLLYALPALLKNADPTFLKTWIPEVLSDLSKNSHFLTVISVFWSNFIAMEAELYPYRKVLIRPLIVCLSKAALSVFSAQDHKSYPFEISKIILSWLEDPNAEPIEEAYVEQYVHTLIKLFMLCSEFSPESKLFFSDGLGHLERVFKLIQTKSIKFKLRLDYFIKNLPPQTEVSEDAIVSSSMFVKIISIISSFRDDSQLASEYECMLRFFHFCLTSCSDKLVSEICKLLPRLGSIKSDKFNDLLSALQHFILESLQNARALPSTFMIMNALASCDVSISDNIMTAFLRAFQKICTDHITRIDQTGDVTLDENSMSTFAKALVIPPMKFAISTICEKSLNAKNIVYNAIRMIWENTMSSDILRFIIEKIEGWFNSDSEIVDFKEKSEIISSSSKIFDIQDDSLMENYLELILLIYSSPRLRATELTVKLEGSFLYGLCYHKKSLREKFFKLVDELIPKKIEDRVIFIFSSQRWNLVSSSYWITFALEFILAAWPRKIHSVSSLSWPKFADDSQEISNSFSAHIDNVFISLKSCIYKSNDICHKMWLQIFPQIWEALSLPAREELSESMIKVLADPEFHNARLSRPNTMMTILDGLALLPRIPEIPNNLVYYIGSEFGAWYSACVILENKLAEIRKSPKSHDYGPIKDLCLLYDRLGDSELSGGLIRRFSIFPETNIAISFEQNNYWMIAQKIFEKAQLKARNGTIPFFEDEYIVWETHWENCAKKLQQWDLLSEVAKIDSNTNLSLECEWVLNDWSRNETKSHIENLLGQIKESSSKKKLMESFIVLNQLKDSPDKLSVFQNSMENLVQDLMDNWSQLPETPCPAHCSALEQLQIIVEVQESQSFFANVSNSVNRPQFLQELKALLSTWRDRLPNKWEDSGVWSNLLAWRQHVFTAINSVFHISAAVAPSDSSVPSNPQNPHPFAYRGYHETAWLINRFAHVARKNGMFDVSLSFLNKIYTLPNIEIQDAFLKLREQAKCYMENPNELPTALEVINATNLNYFNNTQKAEFFTLKAIVLSRLGMIEEANRIFAQAVQIDLNIAKGWSSWGYFNDQRFQQSKDITFGVNAVNCYLQAATLCKNVNSRKYLTRVLWLLTFEDASGSMSKSFELYNHDLPSWYWVPFISELLTSLNRREARQARFLLMKIAKSYPQALYLQLRTFNEEFKLSSSSPTGSSTPIQSDSTDSKFSGNSPNPANSVDQNISNISGSQSFSESMETDASGNEQSFSKKSPHEHTEDLTGILKTGYPLLALSLENMVEHIIHRLRSSPEEDLYRIITTLITENIQQTMIKLNANLSDQSPSPTTVLETSLKKVADILGGSAYLSQKFKSSFENDFLKGNLSLTETLDRLLKWRHQLGTVLDKLPSNFHLENFSRYLAEFEHQKYDEIDVPGQYLLLREVGSDFVKLERFDSQVEITRRHGSSFRRIIMIGNDGSRTPFIVQNPASRQSRREERVVQLLRMADAIVDKNIVSKRHSLSLGVQSIVPISAFVRLIQDHDGFVSLEDVYERHCRQVGILPEDPLLYFRDAMLKGINSLQIPFKKGSVDLLNLRVDLYEEICKKIVPSSILSQYIKSIYVDFSSFWNFRRKFTSQYASLVFTTYILAIGHRFPHKIGFSRNSCALVSSELLPSLNQSGQLTLTEAVPFRLTPNIQEFLTEFGIEGPFSAFVVALGQALSGKKQELADYLTLFIRDEIFNWANTAQGASVIPQLPLDDIISMQSEIASKIFQNVEIVMKRVQTLGCSKEVEKAAESLQPLDQTILDLISCAANPQKLAHMDCHWHPWL